MPETIKGRIVLWYPSGNENEEPTPAVVTQVNGRSIMVSLFVTNSYNLPVRDGVRHINDPEMKDQERIENGAWDHHPDTITMLKLDGKY